MNIKRYCALALVLFTVLVLFGACGTSEKEITFTDYTGELIPAQGEGQTGSPDKTPEDQSGNDTSTGAAGTGTETSAGTETSGTGSQTTDPEPVTVDPQPSSGEEFVPTGNVNPLTGLCDGISDKALTRRPVAIMVSNSYDSLPQWGISQADIIYEMLVEGRITRFLAIFQDPSKIEKLASIRSARPYFIDIAQSYGAVYMHFGGSVPAYDAIAARKDLINIDGIKGSWEGTVFFRDKERRSKLGYEHSVYTTGEYIENGLARLSSPLDQDTHPSAFTFASKSSASDGRDASLVRINFSSSNKPYFVYDDSNGVYRRYQYNTEQMDGYLNQQVTAKNLFVIEMKTTDIKDSDLKLVSIQTTGSGKGYYFCDGKYINITWKKSAYNSQINYYDENGSEIVCERGQSFISVVMNLDNVEVQ